MSQTFAIAWATLCASSDKAGPEGQVQEAMPLVADDPPAEGTPAILADLCALCMFRLMWTLPIIIILC